MFRHRSLFAALLLSATALFNAPLYSQERITSSLSVTTDAVSSYIWRGTRQGRGPHLQPGVEFSSGSFTGGVWGTLDFHGYKEADLYLALDLPAGFSIGLQDYWITAYRWTDFSAESGGHALEASLGYDTENVSLFAGYILNEAGGAGSSGGDLYLESRFSFDWFTVFMGAGTGWHTLEGQFRVCSIGLEVSEDLPLTERFTVPVTGQIVYNPDSDRVFLTAGLSFSFGSGD
ncbi:MAG: hypothetical protein QUS66_04045 [Bacteroidota bacterium]|jgi:hypothetical protein|nr:hypothetical protein [Bacteroidota bacterium]